MIKVKNKGQVTLPVRLRQQLGLSIGDLLEAKFESGKITLTPQSVIDKRIIKSLEDFKRGRSYGPFHTADELIASLEHNLKKRAKKLKRP